jgi:hypothetical protein
MKTKLVLARVQKMLGQSANIADISKAAGLSRQTDPTSAETALAMWCE